tara:strand:- start:24254 stop:24991 length:738 start_codon:yes stop_codon:yes gene_type:complete
MDRKKILVTGGSRGIGKSIAHKFASKSYEVIISYSTNIERAEDTVNELNKFGMKCQLVKSDFNSHDSIKEMYAWLNNEDVKLDVLVNNAGWTKYIKDKDINSLPLDDFQKIIKINLESVYYNIQCSLPLMNQAGSSIINISSIAGYNATGSNIAYCAAKAGVNSLTKSFAKILGPNIRVNGIAPGLTETEMTMNGPKEYYENQTSITPLGRIARPEDIADVAFSLVEDMKFINGKTIVVDGGRLN